MSTRNCCLLNLSVQWRRVPPLMSAALISLLVVGAGLSALLHPGFVTVMVPAGGGWNVILGGASAAWAAVPGAVVRVSGTGVRVGPLCTECCHLAGEVLDTLQKCGAVGVWDTLECGWVAASPARMACMLGG
jgi:hypothetical protein